jgi:hypothetical protein
MHSYAENAAPVTPKGIGVRIDIYGQRMHSYSESATPVTVLGVITPAVAHSSGSCVFNATAATVSESANYNTCELNIVEFPANDVSYEYDTNAGDVVVVQ